MLILWRNAYMADANPVWGQEVGCSMEIFLAAAKKFQPT